MRILITEGKKSALASLAKQVKKSGHEAKIAAGKDQALKQFRDNTPDLVLLDALSAPAGAFKIAKSLREVATEGWVPILYLVNDLSDDAWTKGVKSGGDDFLIHPLSDEVLQAKLTVMQRLADMRHELHEAHMALVMKNHRDPLTGIANRDYFESYLPIEIRRSCRFDRPLSVLMIDIDHFKAYNEHYGREAGDACLNRVAKTISNTFKRELDWVCRYGGEEFVVVLPATGKQESMKLAKQVCAAIRKEKIPHEKSDVSDVVTVSIGCATMSPEATANVESLVTAADQAMYVSKEAGRGQVHCLN